ncbi:conserved hypothetical protein [Vibrio crassostreae]|nr:conserved hypothetical protein [Vibrio crassostreae]CAK1704490.1 conserved hypothetical protein [Vibrio crassostreae]CAK1705390.1 conserved hypothetical protein [Vibrio crassostreae]CAK1705538.1 conserved hypothetical protein [Vibrio crassostreae]CAK1719922.1 conserved hypothetical protein [Vibrio crassostreae]
MTVSLAISLSNLTPNMTAAVFCRFSTIELKIAKVFEPLVDIDCTGSHF